MADAIGTDLYFGVEQAEIGDAGPRPAAAGDKLRYLCKGTKRLNFRRVILTPRATVTAAGPADEPDCDAD